MSRFLLDGVPCPDGRGALSLDDPALWTGMAVFETLRTYGGRPHRVDVHLARLRGSAQVCGIFFDDALAAALTAELAAVAATIPGESKLNVLLTAGGHRVVKAEPLDLSRAGAPVRIATRPWAPDPWLPGRVKHTSRAAWVLAARQAGVDEVVWIAPDPTHGQVWTEANRSNLFVVRDGVLLTPPDDGRILQGVTRDGMIAAARAAGVPCREEPVPVGPADELYLCSTLKQLAPVVELDGAPGPGAGPVGAKVLAAFRAEAERLARA
jgi:branched-subunit amino acid aminotransferase/4-amino-4-deoxychorismate lyase